MFKYVALIVLLCAAGCQTTQTNGTAAGGDLKSIDRNEKLLLRIEKIVGTYEVVVQRAALKGNDLKEKDQWGIIGSASVSGYPGTFRASEETRPIPNSSRIGTYLLDGTPVKISQESGEHLIVKIIPEMQNTARVVGVFVQVTPIGSCYDTFSLSFDLSCNLGEVVELYSKEVPVERELSAEEVDQLIR